MPRPEIDTLIDLSQPEMNRRLRSRIATCEGIYDVKIKPKRSTRSSKANAYYWAAVVTPFYEFLREQEPLLIKDKEQAHIELKRQVLGTAEVKIGKAKMRAVPTTHDMDVKAFMDYVERARFFLSEMVGLETLDPGEFGVANIREGQAAQ